MDNCDDQTTLCSNNFGSFDCICLTGYHNIRGNICQRECNYYYCKMLVSMLHPIEYASFVDLCMNHALLQCHTLLYILLLSNELNCDMADLE